MPKRETVSWKELNHGTSITEAGGAQDYETGDWKTRHPVLDKSKCNKCGLCFIYCPEGCIHADQEGFFISNLKYCKGCVVCAVECPRKAITMENEVE